MKQTAVEWLIEQITLYDELDEYHEAVFEKAKEMEKWQRMKFEIPELSDEEIENAADNNTLMQIEHELFIDGAKWYREQLKQRQ